MLTSRSIVSFQLFCFSFVIAREKDPPNSRIAKILTEKQQEEDEENNKGEEKAVEKELKWNNNSSDK